jgi:hypothetical protein
MGGLGRDQFINQFVFERTGPPGPSGTLISEKSTRNVYNALALDFEAFD